jgi:hypothetical protein
MSRTSTPHLFDWLSAADAFHNQFLMLLSVVLYCLHLVLTSEENSCHKQANLWRGHELQAGITKAYEVLPTDIMFLGGGDMQHGVKLQLQLVLFSK